MTDDPDELTGCADDLLSGDADEWRLRLPSIRHLSTDQLKRMWDDPDRFGHLCDDLFRELNKRGAGSYAII